ncbi:adenylate kinase [Candidatus Providencia siddallii]|uniref:Adenylate kinase n=1 Tax=Candidatus Providencia siddallii TaxID=1715285 RepID=A0ABM9NNI8_9GAMM
MRIILLGAPGTGKGTQASFISKKYNIPHISTGNILRSVIKSGNKLGLYINDLMNNGKLINDDLVISLIKNRIKENDCCNGFLFDGFPRTIFQANAMKEAFIKIDYIFELIVSDEIIINRIIGRRTHVSSGRIYHIIFNPPKNVNKDDITGEELVVRDDDQENIIRKRLIEYHKLTIPLIGYFQNEDKKGNLKFFKIDSSRGIFEINNELLKILNWLFIYKCMFNINNQWIF